MMPHPERTDKPRWLTPPDAEGFMSDLSLSRLDTSRTGAAWIEWARRRRDICWRLIHNGVLGPVHRLPAVTGHPAMPKLCSGRLFWLEHRDAAASLWEARLTAHGTLRRRPQKVAPPTIPSGRYGETTGASAPNNVLWLFAEIRHGPQVGLHLLKDEGQGWAHAGAAEGRFCLRPRLCASGDGLLAAWDRYEAGNYRIMTAELSSDKALRYRTLPAPDACWETLAALTRSGDGRWYAARCRERVIALDGDVNHHSELVVAIDEKTAWRDITQVNIDHAMNPWMAAYAGLRRFPRLVAATQGAWLVWEEKQDPENMQPPLGRLCAMKVTARGPEGAPVVVLNDRCMFVLEDGAVAPVIQVAAKAPACSFGRSVPYEWHTVHLDHRGTRRPRRLASNRCKPVFHLRTVGAERPGMEHPPGRLFFGDPHLHSRLSKDLDGEPDELYHFARDQAHLDFVAFTENDGTDFTEPLSPSEWQIIRRNANTFNVPGRFTAFVGWEYTLHKHPARAQSTDSHRNVIFRGDDGPLYPWWDGRTPTPEALVARLQAHRRRSAQHRSRGLRVLLHHHHHFGFDITDDTLERNIEVCSGWLNGMRNSRFTARLHALLGQGLRLGFLGGSDNHERNPGCGGALTGVWAAANTRAALFDAFYRRRIFATTGMRPDLRFWINDTFMGGICHVNRPPIVRVLIHCDTPVHQVAIVRDGLVVRKQDGRGCRLEWVWEDTACGRGAHYYYAHVAFAESTAKPLAWNRAPPYGHDAWTSPIRVICR